MELKTSRMKNQLTDLELIIEDKKGTISIKTHVFILCAASDYFMNLFQFKRCTAEIPKTMQIEVADKEIFSILIDSFYTSTTMELFSNKDARFILTLLLMCKYLLLEIPYLKILREMQVPPPELAGEFMALLNEPETPGFEEISILVDKWREGMSTLHLPSNLLNIAKFKIHCKIVFSFTNGGIGFLQCSEEGWEEKRIQDNLKYETLEISNNCKFLLCSSNNELITKCYDLEKLTLIVKEEQKWIVLPIEAHFIGNGPQFILSYEHNLLTVGGNEDGYCVSLNRVTAFTSHPYNSSVLIALEGKGIFISIIPVSVFFFPCEGRIRKLFCSENGEMVVALLKKLIIIFSKVKEKVILPIDVNITSNILLTSTELFYGTDEGYLFIHQLENLKDRNNGRSIKFPGSLIYIKKPRNMEGVLFIGTSNGYACFMNIIDERILWVIKRDTLAWTAAFID